jgi:hypothetical protein
MTQPATQSVVQIDDVKLAHSIIEDCGIGADRVRDMRRDDVFVDSMARPWPLGGPMPIIDGYRIVFIFDADCAQDVFVYAVPEGRPKRPDAFKRVRIQKAVAVGVPDGVVSSMTIDVFKREIGEQLWAQWSLQRQPLETREAAEQMQATLEEILGLAKDEAVDDAKLRQQVLSLVTAQLQELGALEDASTPDKE